jgi:hypothetical protein
MRQKLLGIRRQLEAALADAGAAQQNSIDIEVNYRHIGCFNIRTGMNALQILISETMAATGLRKAQIVALLGFKNISKGIRRFDAFVEDGVDSPGMLDRLPAALGLPAETVRAAYEQTLDQMRAEAEAQRSAHLEQLRTEFRPHIHVRTERTRPSPIFVVAMTGGPDRWLRISLPEEVTALPEHDQIAQAAEIIRQHHAEHKGWAGPFGSITGYYYRSEFERAIEFSVTGQVVGPYFGAFSVATCRMSV